MVDLTLEHAVVLFILMLIAQVPILVAAWVTYLKNKAAIEEAKASAKSASDKTDAVEVKLDNNTVISTEAKDAAVAANNHTATCDDDRSKILKHLSDHDIRIGALETGMVSLKVLVEATSKNIDSTRHEMRSHLQTITNKLDLMAFKPTVPVIPIMPSETK